LLAWPLLLSDGGETKNMKKIRENKNHSSGKPAANCAAILAILAEMARQVNLNIAKIDLSPIGGGLLAGDEDAQD
jgi:hypothetical protein